MGARQVHRWRCFPSCLLQERSLEKGSEHQNLCWTRPFTRELKPYCTIEYEQSWLIRKCLMNRDSVNIDWSYSGKPDGLAGTGATPAEKALLWGATAMFTLLFVVGQLVRDEINWSAWQWVLFAAIAFDIAGGVTANTLNSCKRLYLSAINEADPPSIRRMKNHWLFAGLHVHPIVVAILYPNTNLIAGIVWYAALLLSIAVTLHSPLYLRRPVAFSLIVFAVGAALYFLPLGAGFEWLMPLMFMKNVYGHSVREEPYRPTASE